MTTVVIPEYDLTPERAKSLLETSLGNRSISGTKVDQYVHFIREGRMRNNGDTIRVYSDGSLADGHHRCTAVVKAGKGYQTILVTGLDRELDGPTIDQGKSRSAVDIVKLRGGLSNGAVAALSRSLMILEGANPHLVNPQDVAEFILNHPGDNLTDAAHIAQGMAARLKNSGKTKRTPTPSMATAAYYIIKAGNSPELVRDWMFRAADGDGFVKGESGYLLHKYLMRATLKSFGAQGAEDRRMEAGPIIRAWNLFARGTRGGNLQQRKEDARALPRAEVVKGNPGD